MVSVQQRRSSLFLLFSSANRITETGREFVEFHRRGAGRSDHDVGCIRPKGQPHHRFTNAPLRTIPPNSVANTA
jgi:hypothetical protein